MKILGIGVDVVNNRRIQPLIKNQNFIKRTFGPNELKFSKNKVDSCLLYTSDAADED